VIVIAGGAADAEVATVRVPGVTNEKRAFDKCGGGLVGALWSEHETDARVAAKAAVKSPARPL
jgi:hypothetical protein